MLVPDLAPEAVPQAAAREEASTRLAIVTMRRTTRLLCLVLLIVMAR
jgi:hypothetical protein